MPPPVSGPQLVSASDIGSYTFCGRAFWLQKVRRVTLDATTRRRLDRGTAAHASHGRLVAAAHMVRRWAIRCVLAVLLGGLLWRLGLVWLQRRGGA